MRNAQRLQYVKYMYLQYAFRIRRCILYFKFFLESILHNTADKSVFPDVNIYNLQRSSTLLCPRRHMAEALSDDAYLMSDCLSDVYLSRTWA